MNSACISFCSHTNVICNASCGSCLAELSHNLILCIAKNHVSFNKKGYLKVWTLCWALDTQIHFLLRLLKRHVAPINRNRKYIYKNNWNNSHDCEIYIIRHFVALRHFIMKWFKQTHSLVTNTVVH